METHKEERLADILLTEGLITDRQLEQAVQCQVIFGGRLGTNLLELGFISKDALRALLEKRYRLSSVHRDELKEIPTEVVRLIPRELAEKHKLMPVRVSEEGLEVAMLDPWRQSSLQVLAEKTSLPVKPLLALELDLAWALERYYGTPRELRYINLDRWIDAIRPPEKKTRVKSIPAKVSEPIIPNPGDITGMEGAPPDLDEFWDRVGRTGHPEFHLPRVLARLSAAESRDEIAETLLDFAGLVFRRCILFVIHQDLLMGWDGRGEGISERLCQAIMLPLSLRSVFKTVVETGAYFLGPLPDTQINRRFLAVLGPDEPRTVLLLPVVVAGKVAAILYGDMGHEQKITGKIAPLQQAMAQATQSFQKLILKSKSDELKSLL